MNKDNFDFENEIPETKSTKYSDLALGLDFDLSFLDDIDESVLEEESPVEELPKEAPKPVKKAAPAKKVVDAEVPAKKAKKPVQKEQAEAERSCQEAEKGSPCGQRHLLHHLLPVYPGFLRCSLSWSELAPWLAQRL